MRGQRSRAQGGQCKHSRPVASILWPKQDCGELKSRHVTLTVPEDTGENVGCVVSY